MLVRWKSVKVVHSSLDCQYRLQQKLRKKQQYETANRETT